MCAPLSITQCSPIRGQRGDVHVRAQGRRLADLGTRLDDAEALTQACRVRSRFHGSAERLRGGADRLRRGVERGSLRCVDHGHVVRPALEWGALIHALKWRVVGNRRSPDRPVAVDRGRTPASSRQYTATALVRMARNQGRLRASSLLRAVRCGVDPPAARAGSARAAGRKNAPELPRCCADPGAGLLPTIIRRQLDGVGMAGTR